MPPLPISVLLLARDEADRLAALLPTLGFAREIVVVVDAATRDASREIAERLGARVFVRPLDGFGPQRRFGLAQCREEWVLWIDCDEALDSEAAASLAPAVNAEGVAGYRFTRRGHFLGRPIAHCGWQNEKVTRLFRRAHARFDDAPVHERVAIEGAVRDLPGRIEHWSYATWDECRDKLVRYAAAGAEKARRAGRRTSVLDLVARPPLRFARMYLFQLGILDGAHGLLLCLLASAQVFLKYAELWARPEDARPPGPPA